jgi:hypothetical protein
VPVERRLDESLAVRYGEGYLPVQECTVAEKTKAIVTKPAQKQHRATRRGSDWNRNFDIRKSPKIWQAATASGQRRSSE